MDIKKKMINYLGTKYIKISDELYLKLKYRILMGQRLNLKNPQTFNEKLQWLKMYDHNPLYTKLVDKYEVRKFIKEKIGDEYLISLLGVYNKFDEIDFSKLPDKFVIKCNHDSGGIVICKNKKEFDYELSRKKIEWSLKHNYFYNSREWPYKNVVPKIIIEEYMEDDETNELIDYKFMCFNGEPEIIFTCTDRFSKEGLKVTFFDKNWNRLPFERHYPASTKKICKPVNYHKMLEFSRILSANIPFVRVDFYEINKKLYFGELTFYPGSGFEEFTPKEWDYKIGNMIDLSVIKKSGDLDEK